MFKVQILVNGTKCDILEREVIKMHEITNKIGFISDMDGVIYHGNQLLPGVHEFLDWLNKNNKKFLFLTNSSERSHIPRHYSTQMQVMVNSLNKMPLSDNKVSGSEGITVLMANSLMFQRLPTHDGYEDPQLSNFYGLALPFLKRGVPVKTAHIENLAYGALDNTEVLLMSYSNLKPLDPVAHDHLAEWVKDISCPISYFSSSQEKSMDTRSMTVIKRRESLCRL